MRQKGGWREVKEEDKRKESKLHSVQYTVELTD